MKTMLTSKPLIWTLIIVVGMFFIMPAPGQAGPWSGTKKVCGQVRHGARATGEWVAFGIILGLVVGLFAVAAADPYVRPVRVVEYEDYHVNEYRSEFYDHGCGRGRFQYYRKHGGNWVCDGEERWE